MKKMCFGTANFARGYGVFKSRGFTNKKINQIFQILKKNKIKEIDTGITYKNVEKKLGKVNLDFFKIYTKLPKIPKQTKNIDLWIKDQIESSLSKIKIKNFEGIFMHHPEDLLKTKKNEIYNSLLDLKKNKKIKKIGLSLYDLDMMKKLNKNFKFDMIQIPYNIFDRSLKKRNFLKKLKKKKIEIHIRSIFLQGILLKSPNSLPRYFKKWKKKFINFDKWCNRNKILKIEACINTILKDKLYNKILVSATNASQLNQIFDIIKKKNLKMFPKNFETNDKKLIDPRLWQLN